MPRLAALVAVAAVMGLTAGCGHAGARAPGPGGADAATRAGPIATATTTARAAARSHRTASHVITIVMENKEDQQVLGSRAAPYINRLAQRGGLATHSFGVGHPSLPNYLALTSGATHGIDTDCTDCHVDARNIADQLESAGRSWKAYLEDLPRPCFTGGDTGDYAKRHNPFAYYDDVIGDPARCHRMVALSQLSVDRRAGRLPAYALVSPNVCHDMHDCGVATGDRFLARLVPPLLRAVGPRGFVIVTFDEGISNAGCCGGSDGGRIPTIVVGAGVRRGARMARPIDHYGVLATVEDALGLPRLGAAADSRHGSLWPLFRRSARIR